MQKKTFKEKWPSIANVHPPTAPLYLPFHCKYCGDLVIITEKDLITTDNINELLLCKDCKNGKKES